MESILNQQKTEMLHLTAPASFRTLHGCGSISSGSQTAPRAPGGQNNSQIRIHVVVLVFDGNHAVGADLGRLLLRHAQHPREGRHGVRLEAGFGHQQHHGAHVLQAPVVGPRPKRLLHAPDVYVDEACVLEVPSEGVGSMLWPVHHLQGALKVLQVDLEPVGLRYRVVVREYMGLRSRSDRCQPGFQVTTPPNGTAVRPALQSRRIRLAACSFPVVKTGNVSGGPLQFPRRGRHVVLTGTPAASTLANRQWPVQYCAYV